MPRLRWTVDKFPSSLISHLPEEARKVRAAYNCRRLTIANSKRLSDRKQSVKSDKNRISFLRYVRSLFTINMQLSSLPCCFAISHFAVKCASTRFEMRNYETKAFKKKIETKDVLWLQHTTNIFIVINWGSNNSFLHVWYHHGNAGSPVDAEIYSTLFIWSPTVESA